ncbi:RlpA-like double-psi beta-barrel-protein domain-containing protein-containing protein [Neurospora hispaniola]|uniref:RlpA-like double-psi beta-barrel-protein domain-containing protein-containing protein n=1 Tax=Neurospora hispaniola TaxID=588809 RepID=A0AAJ0I0Y3_9PEZI|nr:RlpA-like double-psi beta-barrel-protein domain-containing protein-containing protein [Neurospora hispaniola]
MLFQPILTSTLSLLVLSFGFTFAAPAPAPAPATGTPIAIREVSTTETLDPRSFSSRITWYNTGLGACGTVSNDGQLVVALNHDQFDPSTPNGNPNRNSLCGRRIRVNANGRSVTVTLVDRCAGCPYGGLDLSPAAFSVLASTSVGVVQGSWDWA